LYSAYPDTERRIGGQRCVKNLRRSLPSQLAMPQQRPQ
jgi:hypothetical protein